MPNAATRPLFETAQELGYGLLSRLCRAGAGERRARAPIQHLDPGRQERPDRRQVSQGASARAMPITGRASRSSISRSAISTSAISRFRCPACSAASPACAICNDRRWPETYRVMALQGAELVMLGYNTPTHYPPWMPVYDHLTDFHNTAGRCRPPPTRTAFLGGGQVAKAGREEGWNCAAAQHHAPRGVKRCGRRAPSRPSPTSSGSSPAATSILRALQQGEHEIQLRSNTGASKKNGKLITERTGAIPPPME